MIIDDNLIFSNLECENSNEVLRFLSDNLEKNGYVKSSFYDGLLEREAAYPTGLDFGEYSIAMPHTEVEHVVKSTLSIATLKKKVDFKCAEDHSKDTPVEVVCVIAFGEEDKIDVLTKLISFFGDKEEFYKMLASDKDNLIKIVKKHLES